MSDSRATSRAFASDKWRTFASNVIAPSVVEREKTGSFDPLLWKQLADEGFWRHGVGKAAGGLGGGVRDFASAFSGLARGADDSGFMVSVGAHASLIQLLLRFGTRNQVRDLLPELMSGGVGATASTELRGGSHVSALTTRATPTDGHVFAISGEKVYITNAPIADLVLVVARVEGAGRKDISLFLARSDAAGVTLGSTEDLLGLRTSPSGSIRLANVLVDHGSLLGTIGDGLEIMYWGLSLDRLCFGLIALAQIETDLESSLQYAMRREAFGQKIVRHQFIQQMLVSMRCSADTVHQMAQQTLDGLASDHPETSMLASMLKLSSAQSAVQSALDSLQIHGHSGYIRGSRTDRHLRAAVGFRIAGGTDEMQKKNVVKIMEEAALSGGEG